MPSANDLSSPDLSLPSPPAADMAPALFPPGPDLGTGLAGCTGISLSASGALSPRSATGRVTPSAPVVSSGRSY
jgi:hypothetical protein